MERRKNIALFVAMVENEISYAVCEGALLAAKEMDANLYIMPVGMIDAAYDDVEANCYRYQYATMLSCAQFKDIDAVVMEYGSITSCIDQAKKNEILQQIGDVPVVLLAGEKEGYSSICMDNSIGIQHAVNHLVKQQNCKKIGFISGPIETSQDARERLEAYKTAMIANGIPMEEDWIAYGNFSEYSEEVVEALLIKHPDMEGLVFANDQMAIGGYHVMRKMGLEPGKDILVTGFDDSSVATSLEPSLTSVKSDSKEMAYRAVLACESVMRGEVVHEFVHSHLMVRESSNVALNDDNEVVRDRELSSLDKELIQDIKDKLCEKYLNVAYTTSETVRMREIFEKYFNYYIHLVNQDGTLALQEEEFINQYNEFSLIYRNGYIDMSRFLSISNSLHECLNRLVKSEEERLRLLQAVIAANHAFMNEMTKQKVIEADTNKNFEIILTCVTRDMLQSSEEEKKKYQTVITKLQKLNFASGYIYTYGNGIVHSKGEKWNSPEWLYLKGYVSGSK